MLIDRQGLCLMANNPGLEIMRVTEDEVVYKSFIDMWPPEERQRVAENLAGAINGENRSFVAWRMNGADKGWWNVSLTPLLNDKGAVENVLASGTDITHLVHMRESLRRTAQSYQSLIENSLVGIFQAGRDNVIQYANAAFMSQVGRSSLINVIGENALSLMEFPGGQVPEALWATGEVRDFEVVHRLGSGEVRTFNANLKAIDENYMCMLQDVTRRNRAEQTIKDRQELFERIFESAGMGVMLADGEGEIIITNDKLRAMLGYSQRDLAQLGFAGVVHPQDRMFLDEKVLASVSSGYQAEGRLRRSDGTYMWARMTVSGIADSEAHENFMIATVEDITPERYATEALRKSEELFRSVFEAATSGLAITDRAGVVSLANAALCRMMGMGRHEIEGIRLGDLFSGASREAFDRALAAGVAFEPFDSGLSVLGRQEIYVRVSGSALRTGSDEAAGMVFLIEDLTGRRIAELALMESERKYRNMVDNGLVGVFNALEDGRALFINDGMKKMLELEAPAEGASLNIKYFCKSPRYWDEIGRHLREFGRIDSYAAKLLAAGGREERTVLMSASLEGGIVSGFVTDITSQEEAREALRRSNERHEQLNRQFNTLLNALPYAVLLITPELDVTWGNEASASEFGGVDVRKKCYEIIHGNQIKCNECPALKCFESGHEERDIFVTDKGRIFEVRCVPIFGPDGRAVNAIEIISDATDAIREHEAQIRTGNLASLGELAAGVAHEINNPINGIINYADMISMKPEDTERSRRIAAMIMQEGERIAAIVSSLLSFARDSKKSMAKVNMKEILEDTLVLINSQFMRDGISIIVEARGALDVRGNASQLRQVLLNLLNNARHALNQRYQSLTGEQKRIEVNMLNKGGAVSVEVKDYGAGMDQSVLEKAFNPFFTTKAEQGGTGLGLSISHGIIESHMGSISISSKKGNYTSVIIELPEHTGNAR